MSQSVRGFRTEEKSQQQGLPPHISVRSVFPELKGKYCAFGGGATLEKSNLICLDPLLGFHLRLKQGALEETLRKRTSMEVEMMTTILVKMVMMMVEMKEACWRNMSSCRVGDFCLRVAVGLSCFFQIQHFSLS